MTPELRRACADAAHVITRDGRLLRGGEAAVHVLEQVGWPLGLPLAPLKVPPLRWLVELGYRIVAANRIAFSRFLFRREG